MIYYDYINTIKMIVQFAITSAASFQYYISILAMKGYWWQDDRELSYDLLINYHQTPFYLNVNTDTGVITHCNILLDDATMCATHSLPSFSFSIEEAEEVEEVEEVGSCDIGKDMVKNVKPTYEDMKQAKEVAGIENVKLTYEYVRQIIEDELSFAATNILKRIVGEE